MQFGLELVAQNTCAPGGTYANDGYCEGGAANCSLSHPCAPIAWTCATSASVGPKVPCSTRRTASALSMSTGAADAHADAMRHAIAAQTDFLSIAPPPNASMES